jgi:phosphoglycolate phosphatase-like HAD superfamily hydrolase
MIIGFDLDGTLIDSLGITLDFLLDSVLRVTGQKMAPEQISRHFGHPEERALTWALAGDEKLAHRVLNDYVETLRGHQDRIQLFRGVAEGLTELSKFITEKNKKNTSQVSLALYTARGRKATEVLFVYHKMLVSELDHGVRSSRGKAPSAGLANAARSSAGSCCPRLHLYWRFAQRRSDGKVPRFFIDRCRLVPSRRERRSGGGASGFDI